MCFKKPKMPAPSAEELQAEAELKQQREAMRAELASVKAEAKERRTQEAIAKATGRYGFRSLLSGRKGGQGFLSRSLMG
jgi:hypothetical protein